MQADRPSTTAAMVAFFRAIADEGATSVRGFADPVAAKLLPPPWSGMLALWERTTVGRAWLGRFAWLASGGGIDFLPLRTRAIDEALRAGVAEQVVILGAGLDGRAWRLPELASSTVFEVDHPATQAYKRAQAAGLAPTARAVRFVAVDFERDALGPALEAAGHRRDARTFWIWEGVIMYLAPEAMRSTLDVVAARSAPGSRIAATYMPPSVFGRALGWFVRAVREPLRGVITPAAIAEAFTRAGFRVLDDSDAREWMARWADLAAVRHVFGAERLIVAERV